MYGVAATGMCCCLNCCCQECVEGARRLLGIEKVTKIFYFFLILVFSVPAVLIFFFLNQWKAFIEYFKWWITCPGSSGGQLGCIGQSVVFRLSLALLILFGLMFVFMLLRTRLSMVINEGCFFLKYLLVVGAVVGFLWVSDDVFMNYAQFSKYTSIVYMVLQSIILIDLFYLSGIHLVKNFDQGRTEYACYLVFLSIVAEAGAVMLNIWGYINFRTQWWGNTLWVNILATIMLIILPVIQLLHFNPQNSLLTTALVSLFISYLCFIAQFSYGNGGVRMDMGSLIADIVCSTLFFVLTMYGSIMGGTGQVKVTRDGNINQAFGVGASQVGEQNLPSTDRREEVAETEQENEQKYTESWQWAKWHFYMCIASIYLSMLITNWISVNVTTGEIKSSNFGFWVRVIIAFATFLLYVWTMIAPRVCPGRDFRVE